MIAKLAAGSGDFALRIHRVHTPLALEPGSEVVLEESTAHYLGRVLRVSVGQPIVLFNGDGYDYAAEVIRAGRRALALAVNSRLPGLPEPALGITVVQALSRGERMDQTLQKCTELGAAAFQPLFSDRSELRLQGEKLERRLEHWQGVVISACGQCGRSRIPPVRPPLTLSGWLEQENAGVRLVLAPEAPRPLAGLELPHRVELAVGPEGGFSAAETEQLRAGGVESVRLGPRILRTETAAPAAVAILQCLGGDLGR
jgi:16S rRNA (uracil1498-N3)-methyltransferase